MSVHPETSTKLQVGRESKRSGGKTCRLAPAPGLQVKVLQQGPATGSEQHQLQIVLDSSVMPGGKGIPEGSKVELHW